MGTKIDCLTKGREGFNLNSEVLLGRLGPDFAKASSSAKASASAKATADKSADKPSRPNIPRGRAIA